MSLELKRSLIITVFALLLAILVTGLTDGDFSLEHYINSLFYMSLPVAMIGVAMYVMKGGFFDFFSYSVKRVSKALSRNSEYHEEINFDTNFKLSERISVSYTRAFLISGLFLTVLSIAVAYAL
jgi:hypothetical protein